jgi:hypothetical protein
MRLSPALRTIVFAVLLATAAGCAGQPSKQVAQKIFPINSDYLTLGFNGTVTRTDAGSDFEYRVDIVVTFLPDAPLNRVESVNLTSCSLDATVRTEPASRAVALQEVNWPLTFHMSKGDGPKKLPIMVFRLRKAAASQAQHVGLSVTDGFFGWPVREELK